MKNSLKDWRSTLTGIALIVSAATQVHHVGDVTNQNVLGSLVGGVGLILAQFPKKTKTEAPKA